ncbi:MAG TPA: hypothetical protein VGJ78_23915 [Vicinamibacterales bacterium]|jgi:hypothetical protein
MARKKAAKLTDEQLVKRVFPPAVRRELKEALEALEKTHKRPQKPKKS